jgi:hypothetical protein
VGAEAAVGAGPDLRGPPRRALLRPVRHRPVRRRGRPGLPGGRRPERLRALPGDRRPAGRGGRRWWCGPPRRGPCPPTPPARSGRHRLRAGAHLGLRGGRRAAGPRPDLLDGGARRGRRGGAQRRGRRAGRLHYRAPFDFVPLPEDADHRYVTADFVTTADGSGIVHLAPAFGADDMAVGRARAGPSSTRSTPGALHDRPLAGHLRQGRRPEWITDDLDERGLLLIGDLHPHLPVLLALQAPADLLGQAVLVHPHHRKRDRAAGQQRGIDWHPEHIRDGRFGNWLENNVDWALSRDRYWGTPCRSGAAATATTSRWSAPARSCPSAPART